MAIAQLTSGVAGMPEIRAIRVIHVETPSPYVEFEQSSLGEGRAIAPPAAPAPSTMPSRALVRRRSPATADRIVAAIGRQANSV